MENQFCSSPILTNAIFRNNAALRSGGGMLNYESSSPALSDVTFDGNTASSGGGMTNWNHSMPVLENVIFSGNSSQYGGGMENDSSNPILRNVAFNNNLVTINGGGMANDDYSNPTLTNVIFNGNRALDTSDTYGGGMTNFQSNSTLVNVTFYNNSATYGGGMLNRDANSNVTLTNVTMSNNTATIEGGAIANGGNLNITNSILWGNSGAEIINIAPNAPIVAHSIIQGGYSGAGNLDVDPLLGPLQDNGGFTPTMALLPSSSAIDAGDDANCPATDQRGVTRPQGDHCDIGAFEYVFSPTPTPTFTPTYTPTPSIITLVLQPNATTGVDSYIYSGSAKSNFGAAVDMGVGEDNGANNRMARSLIKFDLSSIPANATITSATLSLWTSTDLSSNDRIIRVYRLKVPFNEAQVTWNVSATGVNWQIAGASGANDHENTDIGAITILNNELSNIEKPIMLTPAKIQEMVNGTFVNRGFIVVADTESNDRFNYYSSDSATANQRPKLVIQYTISSAAPSNTPSATYTPTRTPTATATQTLSPTNTATRTPTATSSSTPTSTATITRTSTATPTFTSTATSTLSPTSQPSDTPTTTPVPTNTATFTPSPTSTATSTPGGFPAKPVLDNFNRANGSIGSTWSGATTAFSISSNQLDVIASGSSTYILWNSSSFGTDQEAYVTISQIDTATNNEHGLILKSQSSKSTTSGLIDVRYDGVGHAVQVWTYHSTQGWVQYGPSISVTFANGDQFGARARPDGFVEIYQNGALLGTRSITSWPFYANGGYIGLWFVNAPAALLDNFGGGTR